MKFENQSRGTEFWLNRHFLTKNNFIDIVKVHIKKFFFTVNAIIFFEGGHVRPHSSHIPKTTTGHLVLLLQRQLTNLEHYVHKESFIAIVHRR